MTQKLSEMANDDTPGGVPVPGGVRPLILWALGRWGGGMVIGLFFFYAWDRTDTRAALQQDVILEAFKQQSESNTGYAKALEANTESIRSLTRAAERAHK